MRLKRQNVTNVTVTYVTVKMIHRLLGAMEKNWVISYAPDRFKFKVLRSNYLFRIISTNLT